MHRELSDVTNESLKSNKARENASDQAVIRFSFFFDWLKGGREFHLILISYKVGEVNKTIHSSEANL